MAENDLEKRISENIIVCENLVKIYKTTDIEVLALQGLELDVAYGELMAIIGNSGSGKSTFLNMIGGLDRPSAGRLYVDGKDLFKLTQPQLVDYKRNTVGFVWQNNARNLLPYLTALENVKMPMMLTNQHNQDARALELLEMVGIAHRKNNRLSELSGGEQQRVAIAIALANNPKLLLADEPTGAVDARSASYILDVFRDLNRQLGLTIIIVTHDRLLAKRVNRVVSIRDGKTSSEMIMKQSYAERLKHIGHFAEDPGVTLEDEVHDEFAVLDRAGRLQIPREQLEAIGVTNNRVRIVQENGRIILEAEDLPQSESR